MDKESNQILERIMNDLVESFSKNKPGGEIYLIPSSLSSFIKITKGPYELKVTNDLRKPFRYEAPYKQLVFVTETESPLFLP